MPTTGNKLHLRCTNSLQPYANKAQQFLILTLDLRNKVNLASQELDCEFMTFHQFWEHLQIPSKLVFMMIC